MLEQGPLVSFIIPHHGRTQMLKQTVESVCALDFDNNQTEIIVVSQDPTLGETDIICPSPEVQFRVLHRPKDDTISALRNFGAAQTTSKFIAFLDADIELSRNWLRVMLEELLAPGSGRIIVNAIQKNSPDASVLERIRTVLNNVHADCEVRFLPGCNLFMQRSSFKKIGGFPEHLMTCEDYYFTDQAFQLGKLYYSSRATYIHLGEDKKFAEMFKKEIWRAQSNFLSTKGRKITFSELPSLLVPFWLAGFCLLFMFSLMSLNYMVSFFSLILILTPITLYATRLHRHAASEVGFPASFGFYLIYFSARVIGSVVGVMKSFRN